ncbi:MAG: ribosome small subunit-dependent GTPase A [Elusimicrobia bacterium]|nr:ribosome small subunit-dependent GTPase A [Elusimicrobiota bacterium]
MDALERFGWDAAYAKAFEPHAAKGLTPARVAAREGSLFKLWMETGERLAQLSGIYKRDLERDVPFPAVGDWVAADMSPTRAVLHAVLPRRSRVARKEAGERDRLQVLVANVDTIFVVSGLDQDFNLRRLERYLAIVLEGGARPVILLNKVDLCPEAQERLKDTRAVAGEVAVHLMSAKQGAGLDFLAEYLLPGKTVALLGSSGAGKSTLVNHILGREKQPTKTLRGDGRGRHTTTSREMFLTPNGTVLIDTPGLREIQLADAAEGLRRTFEDVEALFSGCKFDNCRHHKEPGCAVLAALAAGTLLAARWDSYLQLKHEQGGRGLTPWEKARANRKHSRLIDENKKRNSSD